MSRRAVLIVAAALACGCANARPLSSVPPTATGPTTAAAPAPAIEPIVADTRPVDPNAPWLGAAAASEFALDSQPEQLVGVWVDVPTAAVARVPLAVALAIDTSGSMAGEPIAHARAAARKVVESLDDGDMIALVTFDDEAHPIVAAQVLGPQSRKRILATIGELRAHGGTALYEGVRNAELALFGASSSYLVRRVVLISDGQATVGPTDTTTLGSLAETGMGHGIQVTALGVGLDYDEHTLDAFAVRSSGRLYHLESSKALPSIVSHEMQLLASTSAASAELELVPAPGVRITAVDAVRSTTHGDAMRVPLGAMFTGQKREVLVRMRVGDRAAGASGLASVRLRYRDPADDGIERMQETVVRVTSTDDPRKVAAHEDDRAQSIIANREAALLAASAAKLANDGRLELAAADLDRAEKALRERAAKSKHDGDRKQMQSSADELGRARKRVDTAAKSPAASRPAAGRAASLELNDMNMALDGF